jgi:uroporphyrinogen III methyltransferase / synthase
MRVILTGTKSELPVRLSREGLDVVEWPLVAIEPIDGPPVRAEGYDWLLLTSRHGVDELFGRLEGPLPKIAVIGPGTADAVRAHGVEPALIAGCSTQEGLVEALPSPAGRVLFAGAEGARGVLVEELQAEVLPLYRTVELEPEAQPQGDLVVLASASAARAYARIGLGLPCVSIGPVTSEEAERLGVSIVAEAETHDLEGLVRAVKLAASRAGSSPS